MAALKKWTRRFFIVYFCLFCTQCNISKKADASPQQGICSTYKDYVTPVGLEVSRFAQESWAQVQKSDLWQQVLEPNVILPCVNAVSFAWPDLPLLYSNGEISKAFSRTAMFSVHAVGVFVKQACQLTRSVSLYSKQFYDANVRNHPLMEKVEHNVAPVYQKASESYMQFVHPSLVKTANVATEASKQHILPLAKEGASKAKDFAYNYIFPKATAAWQTSFQWLSQTAYPFVTEKWGHLKDNVVPHYLEEYPQVQNLVDSANRTWKQNVEPQITRVQTWLSMDVVPATTRAWKETQRFYGGTLKPSISSIQDKLVSSYDYAHKEWTPALKQSLDLSCSKVDEIALELVGEEHHQSLHAWLSKFTTSFSHPKSTAGTSPESSEKDSLEKNRQREEDEKQAQEKTQREQELKERAHKAAELANQKEKQEKDAQESKRKKDLEDEKERLEIIRKARVAEEAKIKEEKEEAQRIVEAKRREQEVQAKRAAADAKKLEEAEKAKKAAADAKKREEAEKTKKAAEEIKKREEAEKAKKAAEEIKKREEAEKAKIAQEEKKLEEAKAKKANEAAQAQKAKEKDEEAKKEAAAKATQSKGTVHEEF
jgi:hypothetical protein